MQLLLESRIRGPRDSSGEQRFRWSVGFGVAVVEPWVLVGTALDSAVLAALPVMSERRLLEVTERRECYEVQRRRAPGLVPCLRGEEQGRAPRRTLRHPTTGIRDAPGSPHPRRERGVSQEDALQASTLMGTE
jgi:hypothetical protein